VSHHIFVTKTALLLRRATFSEGIFWKAGTRGFQFTLTQTAGLAAQCSAQQLWGWNASLTGIEGPSTLVSLFHLQTDAGNSNNVILQRLSLEVFEQYINWGPLENSLTSTSDSPRWCFSSSTRKDSILLSHFSNRKQVAV